MVNACGVCGCVLREGEETCPQCGAKRGEKRNLENMVSAADTETKNGEFTDAPQSDTGTVKSLIAAMIIHAGLISMALSLSRKSETVFYWVTIIVSIIAIVVVIRHSRSFDRKYGRTCLSIGCGIGQGIFLVLPYMMITTPNEEFVIIMWISFGISVIFYLFGMISCSREIPRGTGERERFDALLMQGIFGLAIGTCAALILAIIWSLIGGSKKKR